MSGGHGGHGLRAAAAAGATVFRGARTALDRPFAVLLFQDVLHLHEIGCIGGALGFESYLCICFIAAEGNGRYLYVHAFDTDAGTAGKVVDQGFLDDGFILRGCFRAARGGEKESSGENAFWHSPIINGGSPYNGGMTFGLLWMLAGALYEAVS